MERYASFIKDLDKLFKGRGINKIELEFYGGISIVFSEEVFEKLDNENSKLFKDFRDLVYKHEFNYDFICYRVIEVYEE